MRQIAIVAAVLFFSGFFALPVYGAGTVSVYCRRTPAGYRHSNRVRNNVPLSFVSPHINWAGPFAMGPLQCLAIMPLDGARDAMELKERMDVQLSAILTHRRAQDLGKENYIYGKVYKRIVDEARIKLSGAYTYDVILVGRLHWPVLAGEVQRLILNKVKAGAGLVVVGPWDLDKNLVKQVRWQKDNALMNRIRTQIPIKSIGLEQELALPGREFAPRSIGPLTIRTGRLGEGRVVLLDYNDVRLKHKGTVRRGGGWISQGARYIGLTPLLEDDPLFYDYYYAILAKVLLNAGGRMTGVRIRPESTLRKIYRQEWTPEPVSFRLSGFDGDPRRVTLFYELRDRRNRVVATGRESAMLCQQETGFAPRIPLVTRGLYMLDLWVMDNNRVLDWASAALRVEDTVYLQALELDQDTVTAGEAVGGTVTYATTPGKMLAVHVELWDTHERLLQRLQLKPGDTRFIFKPIKHPLSRTFRVACMVRDMKGVNVDRMETWVAMPDSRVDDFQFLMWANASNTRRNKVIMQLNKSMGVTGYYELAATWSPEYVYRRSADNLARNNLLALPYCYGLWDFSISKTRPYAPLIRSLREKIYPPKIRAFRRYGVMAYSICEENFISRKQGAWRNPEAIRDFQAYLAGKYGAIDALNRIWRTRFKEFGKIGYISFVAARQEGQFTHWLEQSLHRIDRFNQVHEVVARTIRQLDPGARVSFDCVHGMDFDWPRMNKILRAYTQCPLEAFSKTRRDLVGTWIGHYHYAKDEYAMRTIPWQVLFRGGSHVIWWPVKGAFTPDFSEPYLCMQQASQELREIRGGVGRLLMACCKRIDPILILWSNLSYHAGIINPRAVSWEHAREEFTSMLRHVGLDFQAVDSVYVQTRLKFGPKHRVLILPQTQVIADRTAQAIRTFVRAGGLVIADSVPGIMDEYLRPYGGMSKPADNAGTAAQTCPRCRGKGRVQVGNVLQPCPKCGGTGKLVQGGRVREKSILAALFDFSRKGTVRTGKGVGLYLPGGPGSRTGWAGLRRFLAVTGGIRTGPKILNRLGVMRTDLSTYVFDNGNAEFLGILPGHTVKDPPGHEAVICLQEPRHVYNVRQRHYLGFTNRVDIGIVPNRAKLFAFLPHQIQGLNLSLDRNIAARGEAVVIRGGILPAALGKISLVVRARVTGPGGEVAALTRNLAFRGEFSYTVPIALNQEPGPYTVRFEEKISGYVAEVSFVVR